MVGKGKKNQNKKASKKISFKVKTVKSFKELEKKHSKISGIEMLVKEILWHKKVKSGEIKKHAGKIKPHNVIGSPKKPAGLGVLEKRAKTIHKKLQETNHVPIPQKDFSEIKSIATEIKKHRIITDFDRVLFYVNKNKRAQANAIAKKFSIEKKRVLQCAEKLEKEGLIEIDYPIVGSIVLQVKNFKPKKKKKPNKKNKLTGQKNAA